MLDITFKGDLHTIPAGAALVLKVDFLISDDQVAMLTEYVHRQLGQDQRVLVIGRDVTPMAVDQVPDGDRAGAPLT